MTAAARSRGDLVLEHLAAHPDLTAGWDPDQGRAVFRWRVAPPGTVPPPAPAVDPDAVRRRREHDRLNQRARRARARGLAVQPGMEPPSLRSVTTAAADLPGAACRTADPDLFFGRDGEREAERQVREAKAKDVCAGCPVRAACLAYALDTGHAHGVWGGAAEDERRALLRQRRAS